MDGHPVGRRQPLAGAELPAQTRRPERHARDGHDLVDPADPGLEAATAEIEPEDGLVTDPDASPLPEEAESGLLVAGQEGHRAIEDPFDPLDQQGAVAGIPQRGGGQRHHEVDLRLFCSGMQPAHGAQRGCGSVRRHRAAPCDFGTEMQEGAAAKDRKEGAVRVMRPPP